MVIDPARLAAFAAVTVATSIVPGPQMLFVLSQTAWRGTRAGAAALAGLQVGNAGWFVLAGLGLGAVARAAPMLFEALTLAGAAYLAWLGIKSLREAHLVAQVAGGESVDPPPRTPSAHAFRDSLLVAATNPKSLVYILALLPPFVDVARPVAPQLLLLGAIAIVADVIVGLVYIAAGAGLARMLSRPSIKVWQLRVVGTLFLLISAGVAASVAGGGLTV